MDIAGLLTLERSRCGVRATSKKRALERLSELLMLDASNEAVQAVFEGLTLRERLGSTGLGHGVGLPHSRSGELDQPRAAIIRLDQPIEFDAVDRQPVDILFALLVPEHNNDEHLRILSRLAEMFRDDALCSQLRACRGDDDLYNAVAGWQSDNASP
ncbi:MAG: PTS IIA-like nitrogen regulatory protein PtsN [Spiribacter sp.]|nr:PTS IIA-like nitrogen regulatory protein PtsN [Spiribacter sp.]MDR9454671.1 PTS IIA-like nitrogen regulatory protein PtsN [Spiribacter sp.]